MNESPVPLVLAALSSVILGFAVYEGLAHQSNLATVAFVVGLLLNVYAISHHAWEGFGGAFAGSGAGALAAGLVVLGVVFLALGLPLVWLVVSARLESRR